MPSFANTWRRWLLTVCGETKRRSATSRFVSPSATRRATASSDVVMAAHPTVSGSVLTRRRRTPSSRRRAADAAGVPGRAELGVEGQATAENLDRGFAVGWDQLD